MVVGHDGLSVVSLRCVRIRYGGFAVDAEEMGRFRRFVTCRGAMLGFRMVEWWLIQTDGQVPAFYNPRLGIWNFDLEANADLFIHNTFVRHCVLCSGRERVFRVETTKGGVAYPSVTT